MLNELDEKIQVAKDEILLKEAPTEKIYVISVLFATKYWNHLGLSTKKHTEINYQKSCQHQN